MSTINELIPVLRNVSLFSALPDEDLAKVAADTELISYDAGEAVFRKGEIGNSMYVILDGRVCIHDGDLIFVYKTAGDYFGEMAALHAEERSASVTADQATRLLRLDTDRLQRLLNNHGSMAFAMLEGLFVRLRDTSRTMSEDFGYIGQVQHIIEAAQTLEAGTYRSDLLSEVMEREDALGQLARVFCRMADEVTAREKRLQHEVNTLRIEVDRSKQAQQVAEITETDYFRNLREKASTFRKRSKMAADKSLE